MNEWKCVQCNFINQMKFSSCHGCNAYRSKSLRKPEDWNCISCGKLNFSYRTSCIGCKSNKTDQIEKKPTFEKKPGDWDCQWCHKMNFGNRTICFTCSKPKPTDETKTIITEEKDNTCTVCMENNIDTCITPCGHLACCYICAMNMNKCPICRKEYDPDNNNHLIKVYHVK